MFANILVYFLGAVIFLFIFWKKLKDDTTSDIVFSVGFLVIAAILVTQKYFWLQLIAITLAASFGIWKFKMRINEVFDALVIALLPWLALVFLKTSVVKVSAPAFVGFIMILVLIGVYYLVDAHYKKFTWYKSGRIGLSGAVVSILFVLIYIVLATFLPNVLSF